jgi:excisionase family DNA binding protein
MTISRNQPLTTDDMARLAPSALAREASDGMSQRFASIASDQTESERQPPFRLEPLRGELAGLRPNPQNVWCPTEFEPLLSEIDAGKLLGLHPKTVQRLARKGELPAIRVGRYWRFRASRLNAWIDVHSNCQPVCVVERTKP